MAQQYLSADEVVAILGISKSTLYSYVSRGLIRSEETGGKTRARRYVAADVHALQQRKEQRRDPAQSAAAALHFGDPVLESAITLIVDGRLYYRGEDALLLAAQASFEEVVALLWTGGKDAISPSVAPELQLSVMAPTIDAAIQTLVLQGDPADALQMALLSTAPADLGAYNQAADAVAQTGLRILHRLTDVVTVVDKVSGPGNATSRAREERAGIVNGGDVATNPMPSAIAQRLQRAWLPGQSQVVYSLNAALILCADHELNASSFTARCVASTGATPYGAVVAALAALQGYRHGGATRDVAVFLREAASGPARATQERLRAGGKLPGFGHPLYPQGDPRGRMLLDLAEQYGIHTEVMDAAIQICRMARQAMQLEPNLDFGLTVLAQSMGLPPYAPFALFALGRTAGWIGHILEQYAVDQLIRPRARYVGIQPSV